MKKMKKHLFKGVVVVIAITIMAGQILFYVPTNKKVNADEITTAYMDYEVLGNNQVRFILYILDAYTEDVNSIEAETYFLYANESGETTRYTQDDVEFLRYPNLDRLDYDAYIYNKLETNEGINNNIYYAFLPQYFADFCYFPNVIKLSNIYKEGYDKGFNEGYDEGFNEGYGVGLEIGYRDGITEGYAEGFNDGESSQIDVNFMQSIFTSLDAFFQIHFAPNLTIGELFLAPLIIWFVWFIIKQFKGGD